jgi:hypothetical protein
MKRGPFPYIWGSFTLTFYITFHLQQSRCLLRPIGAVAMQGSFSSAADLRGCDRGDCGLAFGFDWSGVFPFAFEPSGPSALLTNIKFREGELMSERKTARLVGLILGGLFTCALMLNAFAY